MIETFCGERNMGIQQLYMIKRKSKQNKQSNQNRNKVKCYVSFKVHASSRAHGVQHWSGKD